MDIFENRFMPALRAGDFIKAEQALEEWKRQTSNAMYLWAKSILLVRTGKIEKANQILSEVINKGQDEDRICHHARADNYLNTRKYLDALSDFNAILSDKTPRVQEMLASDCLFRKSYILAVLGNHEFLSVIDKITPEYSSFIIDRSYDKMALVNVYNDTKKL